MTPQIFQTIIIWFFVLILLVVNCIKYHHVRIFPSVMIVLSITFFSLLTPVGKVLLTIGSLKITDDALFLGLRRGGILVGMVFLSRIIVSKKNSSFLSHFGKTGDKLTEVFYWLNLLTEKKIPLKRGHIIEKIDERLCEIWEID